MHFTPRKLIFLLSGMLFSAGTIFMANDPGIAEPGAPMQAAPVLINAAIIADPEIAMDRTLLSDDVVTWGRTVPQLLTPPSESLDPDLICMAKIVRHEAANQSREGQKAVAQIVMNRVRSGKFRDTVCDVASQPGQFFDLAAYNPRRDNAQWRTAVEVSREVMAGTAPDITNGAYFYHAVHQQPNRFFRTRQRVLALGDHIFYR